MDKLRAIQYFVTAAQAGSLSAAARQLEVSVPAVQKMVNALERELGSALLERGTRGVTLTANGSDYLDCCRAMLEELDTTEAALRRASVRPSGMLTVTAHEQILHSIMLPALPRFRLRYPEIQLDLRTAHRLGDEDAQAADVLLMHGWPEIPPDYVHRQLGLASSLIAAAPDYWRARGLPDTPQALAAHDCLCMRNPFGIVIDLWEFTRGQERCSVKVNGWLLSNAREVMLNAVLRGQGVGRFVEVTMREHVQSGRLVPVLPDWEVQGGPPINLLYRASARRNPRARAFIDFMLQVIKQCEAEGEFLVQHHPSTERPAWHRRGYGRASAAMRGSR